MPANTVSVPVFLDTLPLGWVPIPGVFVLRRCFSARSDVSPPTW